MCMKTPWQMQRGGSQSTKIQVVMVEDFDLGCILGVELQG